MGVRRGQRGQILALTAIVFTALLGAAGLAIDTGIAAHTRTKLQATTDAMALAGVQAFCGTEACRTEAVRLANEYGGRNQTLASDNVQVRLGSDCAGTPIVGYDMISARVTRQRPTVFMNVLGVGNTTITACASAQKYGLGGTNGIRPFALDEQCIKNITYGGTVVLKYDSSNVGGTCTANQGNFSAVRIDGSGASIYENTIKFGSNAFLCAQGAEGCTHYTLQTETGNMISANRDGINYLINNTPEGCRTWNDVKAETNDIRSACNPWLPGYSGASRIIVVPVVAGLYTSGGTHPVPIRRFALVFVEGFNGNCTGNNCEIRARFIKSTLTIPNSKKVGVTKDNPPDITVISLLN